MIATIMDEIYGEEKEGEKGSKAVSGSEQFESGLRHH